MQNKNRIRFFEHPQVFISLDRFERSKRYFKRHLSLRCPEIIDMISDLDSFIDECEKPQTIKIQYLEYITDSVSTYNKFTILDILEKKSTVRPCKISTIARILLTELGTLPNFITSSDFCLGLLNENQIGFFKVDLKYGRAKCIRTNDLFLHHYKTPLIMETDPV